MEHSSLRFDEAKGQKLLPRFIAYLLLGAGIMVADGRFDLMQPVRTVAAEILYPVQWLANQPVRLYQYISNQSQSQTELLEQNRLLLEENGRLKIQLQRDKVNLSELQELKKLYGLQQNGIRNVIGAEVLSTGKDPLSERLIINKGSGEGGCGRRCRYRSKRLNRTRYLSSRKQRGSRIDVGCAKYRSCCS